MRPWFIGRTDHVKATSCDIVTAVRDAGIVGAGGAGFPTHAKLTNKVDTFIANGAECEPILESDRHSMERNPELIVRGLELAMAEVGAERGFIAIKNKNTGAIAAIERVIADKPAISVAVLGNYYPAGDEMVLVRQVTGRVVPPGGIPFMCGVTVSNVITLMNIARAADGDPVTNRIVTVGGEVSSPVTVEVPVGTRVGDLIDYAGGPAVHPYEVILGGPIMGPIGSPDDVITKTIGGIIVLPADHTMIRLKRQPVRVTKQKAKMCCTCQECTINCPRNALGHPISPAKITSYSWHIDEIIAKIESGNLDEFTERMVFESILCCQCGICEQYACIFGLSPNKIFAMIKAAIIRSGRKFDMSKMETHESPMFEYRKVSALTYARKLGLEPYLGHTDFKALGSFVPKTVRISLRQHIGAPAKLLVKVGDLVKTGDCIGDIPEGKLSARIHASIDGLVSAVDENAIVITGS